MTDKPIIVVRTDVMSGNIPMSEEIEELSRVGAEVIEGNCLTEDDIIKVAGEARVLLVVFSRITRRVMEALPRCQAIVRYGIGYDTVDVAAATDNGILVVNVPDFCFEEVSNHAIALLLACAKKFIFMDRGVKAGRWEECKAAQAPMGSIWGQTLGVIGCGNIGRRVARKARCFDLRVIGADPFVDKSLTEECGITLVSLEELLRESDYVSVNTFLNADTRHLLGEKEFRQMKSSAYIINTARGSVIDEPALIKALQEEQIAGAGLDVFEQEPVDPDNPLLKMDNVIALPHSASFSDASFSRLARSVGQEAARVVGGRWPRNVVNSGVKPKIDLVRD
ncbi:MAG: C-terminal binding protein [Dehalococcoidales bacterium]